MDWRTRFKAGFSFVRASGEFTKGIAVFEELFTRRLLVGSICLPKDVCALSNVLMVIAKQVGD